MTHLTRLLRDSLRSRSVACCLFTAVLIPALVAESRAADKSWGNHFGGAFSDPVNWQGGSLAGAADVAHFGLTTNPLLLQRIYTVDFTADATNQALVIEDDFVTFDLNGQTYATTALTGNEIGTVPGRSGRLTINDGTFSMDGTFDLLVGAVANSSGALTVGTDGQLTGLDSLQVGHIGRGTLTLQDGGDVVTGVLSIGNNAGSTGTATIAGAESSLTARSPGIMQFREELIVGNHGTGTLNVTGGARVEVAGEAGFASLGRHPGSSGTVSVSDPGSTLSVTADLNPGLHVGQEGFGALSITGGGRVDITGDSRIASELGSTGSVVVDGPGSTWSVGALLTVGPPPSGPGNGTLEITNGGHVVAGSGRTARGSVRIDGSGSTWSTPDIGGITVGDNTEMTVTGGGHVQSGGFTIGGTVSIDGPGSNLTTTGLIFFNPPAVLDITNGGQTSSSEARLSGTVNIQGPDSKWSSMLLSLSEAGDRQLNVTEGGELSTGAADLRGGFGIGGSITATVDGPGSTWTNTGDLDLGAESSGVMFIQNDGELRSAALRVGTSGKGSLHVSSGGIVSVEESIEVASDPPLSSGTITIEDEGSKLTAVDLYVGGSGSAAGGTGRLEVQGGTVDVGSLRIWNAGNVEVTGGTLNVRDRVESTFPSVLVLAGGTLSIPSTAPLAPETIHWTGGTLRIVASDLTVGTGGPLGDSLGLNSRMNLDVGGLLDIDAGASLVAGGGALSAAGGTNNGVVSVIGGSLTYAQPAANNGHLDAVRAILSFPGDGITNHIGLTNHGVLTLADATINGDVHSPAGSTIKVASGVVFNGLLSGGPDFPGAGTVTFNSGFDPGDSPAEIAFAGDVVFGPNAELRIELAGTEAGTEFDRLAVTGTAALDGTLDVRLADTPQGPFIPAVGNSFEILSAAAGVEGVFAEELLPQLSAGRLWNVLYRGESVVLQVVSAGIPGDYNASGLVEQGDLDLVLGNWGRSDTPNGWVNDLPDGIIDQAELDGVLGNWGQSSAGATVGAAIPEPTSLLLALACGFIVLMLFRLVRCLSPVAREEVPV